MTQSDALADGQGRVLRDLRVSLTDRCDLHCLYCLPDTEAAADVAGQSRPSFPNPSARSAPVPGAAIAEPRKAPATRQAFNASEVVAAEDGRTPQTNLLTFEEIERVVRLAVQVGIQKVRLTGGEPLLRRAVEKLVGRLSLIPGLQDLAMTTSGINFLPKARALRAAGLGRVTFSLDSLEPANFKRITGSSGLEKVLEGIRLAQELGFSPVKVNAVIIKGVNDGEIEALAEFARDHSLSLRFIEFMPLDAAGAWQRERVVPGREILARLRTHFELRPVNADPPAATARRWTFANGGGEIGIIAPVTEPFCGNCTRLRLTADGRIRTCLFGVVDYDLRGLLRKGADDAALTGWLREVVRRKEPRHHIGEAAFVSPAGSMSCIGG